MLDTDLIAASTPSSRLMVVLHGLGDSMEGYRWMPSLLALPWLNYLLVNAPDEYFGGFSWYDIYGDAAPGVTRSRKLLIELLNDLPARRFDFAQTVLFGFSQGSLMTIEIGARYPQLFAGLVGISGYAHEPETLVRQLSPEARQQRWLLTHGTQDPLIPLAPVRQQVQQLRAAGLNIQWHEFPKAHTIDTGAELACIRQFIMDRYPTPPR